MDLIINRYMGVLGIIFVLLIGYVFSNNKKLINYRLIFFGLLLQGFIGYFILKTKSGKILFQALAKGITEILNISHAGSDFVFGFLGNEKIIKNNLGIENGYLFAFQVVPIIIFVCSLVSIFYYLGILQIIIKLFASVFNKLLGVSGAEALANTIVAIVGQVESAIVIQPYLSKLTKSELLTIMTGGMACISGSLMIVYTSLGIKTEYLLAASFMAIPGSFVISKIFYPECETPTTKNTTKIDFKIREKSIIEAILDGAMSGVKISIGIIAMLIAFISLVALIDKLLSNLNSTLSLKIILGYIFYPVIYLTGVPKEDAMLVAQLFGTKTSLNEFVAYLDLSKLIAQKLLTSKSILIASFLLCGFANFSSIAIQVGGLSQMAPDRKSELALLGFKAMICGALTSCVSACIVGILV